jgi:hypothetical protein
VATLKAELAARDASLLTLKLAHTQLQTVVSLQDEHIASMRQEQRKGQKPVLAARHPESQKRPP